MKRELDRLKIRSKIMQDFDDVNGERDPSRIPKFLVKIQICLL